MSWHLLGQVVGGAAILLLAALTIAMVVLSVGDFIEDHF